MRTTSGARPRGGMKATHTFPADGEYRLKLFHALRDLTADSYGAWRQVTNLQGGGGLYAQRVVTRKHYDMDGAKRAALRTAGIDEKLAP